MFDLAALSGNGDTGIIFSCGLLLSFAQEQRAIEISKGIESVNPNRVKFVLNKVTHPPYVRLYEIVLPQKNIDSAVNRLTKITNPMGKFHMEWGAVEKTDHLVAIWGENNDTLKVFHQAILLALQEYREGYFKRKYSQMEEKNLLNPNEVTSLKKWGSPWAEPYVPHMILSKGCPTFGDKKFSTEWKFSHALFQGLLIGIKNDKGEFTHCFPVPFSNE